MLGRANYNNRSRGTVELYHLNIYSIFEYSSRREAMSFLCHDVDAPQVVNAIDLEAYIPFIWCER